jgi:hypothetical protein
MFEGKAKKHVTLRKDPCKIKVAEKALKRRVLRRLSIKV